MLKKYPLPIFILLPLWLTAQFSFIDQTSLLTNQTLSSGCAIGVADMNGDGLDDIIRLNMASNLEIAYQTTPNMPFTNYVFGDIGAGIEWSISVADVDNNGYNDIFTGGGYNSLKLLKANADGTAFSTSFISGGGNIFLQSSSFADINNDGHIDIFPCHDDGLSPPYQGNGMGNFTFNPNLINTATTPISDNSGNYGTVWMDYDSDGDLDMYLSKCRAGLDNFPNDPRRINKLMQNDGNNNYTDVAEAVGLRPVAQSWAADFGDIDNDGDWDCYIINHDTDSDLYIYDPNTTPVYTKHTVAAGIANNLSGGGIQVKFADFNNDGFADLLVTGIGGHRLFMNDGDGTFTLSTAIPNVYSSNGKQIHSAAVGDLNNDGFLDIYAAYANDYNSVQTIYPDRLFMNTSANSNNYLKIRLIGISNLQANKSNINGIGARLELYGAWGMQIREVRSGEGYSVVNSLTQHFGIGTATEITKLVVRWPSGTVDEILNPAINQTLTVTENPGIVLPLTLIAFSATAEKNHHQITWTTSEEHRMSHFVLERSENARDFETVEIVAATNKRSQHTYVIKDKKANNATVYRLKMVQQDEQLEYSDLVWVERSTDFLLHDVLPNPAQKEDVQVYFETKKASMITLSMVDMTGQILIQKEIMTTEGLNQYTLESKNWQSGLYFLMLKNGEQTQLRKLMIQ